MILTGILTGILWDLFFFRMFDDYLSFFRDSLGLSWIICDYFWDSEGSFWISGDSLSFFRDSFGISLGFFGVSGCQGLFRDLVGILWYCLGLSAILFGILRNFLGFLGFSVVLTGLFWDLVGILWDYLGLSAIRFGIFLDFNDSLSFFSGFYWDRHGIFSNLIQIFWNPLGFSGICLDFNDFLSLFQDAFGISLGLFGIFSNLS